MIEEFIRRHNFFDIQAVHLESGRFSSVTDSSVTSRSGAGRVLCAAADRLVGVDRLPVRRWSPTDQRK